MSNRGDFFSKCCRQKIKVTNFQPKRISGSEVIVKNVTGGILPPPPPWEIGLNLLDPVEAAILKCKNHPSLNAIRGKISRLDNPNFYFEYTSYN